MSLFLTAQHVPLVPQQLCSANLLFLFRKCAPHSIGGDSIVCQHHTLHRDRKPTMSERSASSLTPNLSQRRCTLLRVHNFASRFPKYICRYIRYEIRIIFTLSYLTCTSLVPALPQQLRTACAVSAGNPGFLFNPCDPDQARCR